MQYSVIFDENGSHFLSTFLNMFLKKPQNIPFGTEVTGRKKSPDSWHWKRGKTHFFTKKQKNLGNGSYRLWKVCSVFFGSRGTLTSVLFLTSKKWSYNGRKFVNIENRLFIEKSNVFLARTVVIRLYLKFIVLWT